jgi:hypothetical protein
VNGIRKDALSAMLRAGGFRSLTMAAGSHIYGSFPNTMI